MSIVRLIIIALAVLLGLSPRAAPHAIRAAPKHHWPLAQLTARLPTGGPQCRMNLGGLQRPASPTVSGSRSNVDVDSVVYPIAAGLNTTEDWKAEGDQAIANFGWSVGPAGDVNGDGYADVIVGAPGYENGETAEGRAFVYYGSATGLSTTADWTAESDQALAIFGSSVATAGDVNGDGYDDVIVGAPGYSNGETAEGRAFVYHGSALGLSTTTAWTADSNQASAHLGGSVGTAGDVNGDSYADVIVGASSYGLGGGLSYTTVRSTA